MSDSAFDKALSKEALRLAWDDIYSNASAKSKKTMGIDSLNLHDFADDHITKIQQLNRRLKRKSFGFSELRAFIIPKSSGNSFRIICVPTVSDRIVQRALVRYLGERYGSRLSNKVSYGFVKGRTVQQAAKRACQLRAEANWVFKTDITSFFDRISRALVHERIEAVFRERSLWPILHEAVECEVHEDSRKITDCLKKKNIQRGVGLRQGMALSPMMSNLLLQSFDQKIEKWRLNAVRYADDLIFFGRSRDECLSIRDFCESELGSLGLSIPPVEENSKSVIYAPNEAAEFLGAEISPSALGYSLQVPRQKMVKIREDILSLGSIKELNSRGVTIKSFGFLLAAKIGGFVAAYEFCENTHDLERVLEKAEAEALKRIFTLGLGVDLRRIDSDARAFLGIS